MHYSLSLWVTETTDDLTPEIITSITQFAPQMLGELTPDMLLVMPIDALLAIPVSYIADLDPELQAQLVERLAETEEPVLVAIPLPDSWIQGASAMGFTLETTDDLSPEIIQAITQFAPQMLDELTPDMLLVVPVDVLLVLPAEFIAGLDAEVQAQLAERMADGETEPVAVPLPDSWIQGAAAQGFTLETTADLTPEVVTAIANFAPQMLDDLTSEILLVLPAEVLVVLPVDYLEGLDPELKSQLEERMTGVPTPEEPQDTGELPSTWQAAGEAQGIVLVVPEDVTPEIIQGIAGVAPQLLDMLSPDNLRRFSPEVLAWLPAEYIATLDSNLVAELDELAQPAGGLGFLAVEAAAEAEALSAGAPELSGAWRQPPPEDAATVMPTFETAADLKTSGFTDSAAELLNLLLDSGQEGVTQLVTDLTPDVIAWLVENEENFLVNLSPAVLRLLSPEVRRIHGILGS
jgi:hypothetical protein